MNKSIKYTFIVICIILLIIFSALGFAPSSIVYFLEKDQARIKEIVANASLANLKPDYCYENKCIYKLKVGECQRSYILTYTEKLNAFIDSLKTVTEKEVCLHKNS